MQSWDVARLYLSWDKSSSESPMAGSGLKSSGVRGRSLSSGSAPECPVQGAGVHHSGAAQVVCSGEMQVRPFASVNTLFM